MTKKSYCKANSPILFFWFQFQHHQLHRMWRPADQKSDQNFNPENRIARRCHEETNESGKNFKTEKVEEKR